MAQETNDTILWIPDAIMAQITAATAVIGSRQTGGPDTPGDYRMVRGTLHSGTATLAVAAALTSGQWTVNPGPNEGELVFGFSEYGALNGGNPVKWAYSVNDGADWSDVPGSETADGALGSYTATGLVGGTVYTDSIRARLVTNLGDGTQSADAKSATVTGDSESWPDSGLVSDNFEAGTLGAHWTETAGHLPGGWSFGNDGSNFWMQHQMDGSDHFQANAARRMQVANDVDFQAVVMVTAALPTPAVYHYCGLFIEQDSNDRIEAQLGVHSSTTRFVDVENVVNGSSSAPIAELTGVTAIGLRVTRAGDDWTIDYTTNGTDWIEHGSLTRAMTVAKVGIMHGQAGGTRVIRFDYFEVADAPLESGEDS